MAMVERPDLIMTSGGGEGLGGGTIWIFLLAFLFLFRGGHGFGGGEGGRGDRYEHDHLRFDRRDADFMEARRDRNGFERETMRDNFAAREAAAACCCETQRGLDGIKAEVANQGNQTRCEMRTINNETIIAALNARLAEQDRLINREATIAGVLAGMQRGHFHGVGLPTGGFIPAPAGVRYEGYSTGGIEAGGNRGGGCPADRF